MTQTEQTNHLTWTNVRIRNLLKLHEQRPGGLVSIGTAEDVCKRVRDELAAELMALRSEVATLKAGNLVGHLEDDDD